MRRYVSKKLSQNVFCWFFTAVILIVALLSILVGYRDFQKEMGETSQNMSSYPLNKSRNQRQAYVEFDFGNGRKRIFTGDMSKEIYSIPSTLKAASRAGGFDFRIAAGKLEKVNGGEGEWEIYLNSQKTNKSIDQLTITGGDHYLFRLKSAK